MSNPIPKNLQIKVASLYQEYSYNYFTFKDAQELLKVDVTYLGRILGILYRNGWIAKEIDEEDNRVKKYKVIQFTEIFANMDHAN